MKTPSRILFWSLLILPVFCSGAFTGRGVDAMAADEALPLIESYEPEQVAENIYVIHGPIELPNPQNQGFMNNPGFVITADGVVVIDAGSSLQVGRMVAQAVASVTDDPIIATFSTHVHGDHWLGNQAILESFPDAKMYAHPRLIEVANAGEAENWVSLMDQLTVGATRGTIGLVPDLSVNHGDSLSMGGFDFMIHHKGKAHTDSDIAIAVFPGNTLFTGDLVFNHSLRRMDDGSFTGSIGILEHLISLDPSVVVPGHGQTGGPALLVDMQRLQKTLYETIEVQFEQGVSDFEMKPVVVSALAEFTDWEGFDEGIGRLVSLGYLEVEENNF
jgi:glyoxylase-like metal-dependent hydrolase (beta-lactamase superfamily II)